MNNNIISDTVTGPAHWASALINGDWSSMDEKDTADCLDWLDSLRPWAVVGTTDEEPWWSSARGQSVLDYIIHRIPA